MGQSLPLRKRFKVISSQSQCVGMLKEHDQAGLEQCVKQGSKAGKEQKGDGRAGGTPRVRSSAIRLWLEGIWSLYSIYTKNNDLATL